MADQVPPASATEPRRRSQTLDIIRGALVVLMVVFHAAYIASMYGLATVDLGSGFWWIFPRGIAAGFVAVSGWSLASKRERGGRLGDYVRRAARLAIPALAVSLVSFVALGRNFVFFGVLHLLAVSSVLAWPLLGRPALALAAGILVFAAGLILGPVRFDWPWLAWLGFRPSGLYPADYLPLLPWFAWVAFGSAARDLASAWLSRRPRPDQAPWSPPRALRPLAFLGRHSLWAYLIHLPLLYGLGWLVAMVVS